MRIAVISAGLGEPSSTRLLADRLAAATGAALAPGDVRFEVIELRDIARDLADNLVTGFPGGRLREILQQVYEADALIAVSPIFSASYSGLFKTFFDVLEPDALTGKPVLIAATGGTPRHSLALEHAFRPLFAHLRAIVVPTAVYAASQDWAASELAERIDRAAGELAALVAARPQTAPKDPYADPTPFEDLLNS
jgi:FMN reductase